MCLGVPAKIVSIADVNSGLAVAETSGIRRHINIALLANTPEIMETLVGQWVLLHVGFAMARIDQEQAEKSLKLLDELQKQEEQTGYSDQNMEHLQHEQ